MDPAFLLEGVRDELSHELSAAKDWMRYRRFGWCRKSGRAPVTRTPDGSHVSIRRPPLTGCTTMHCDRATNTHFLPDKPWSATGKSLIVLNPSLSLNQRVLHSRLSAPSVKKLSYSIMLQTGSPKMKWVWCDAFYDRPSLVRAKCPSLGVL